MRWTTLGTVAAAISCADALSFPRSKTGKGYLSVHVGTVEKPKKEKTRRDGDAFVAVLDNMGYFYATDRAFEIKDLEKGYSSNDEKQLRSARRRKRLPSSSILAPTSSGSTPTATRPAA